MKVKELIKYLEKFNSAYEVVIEHIDTYGISSIYEDIDLGELAIVIGIPKK
jgi:hypothetical protein